MNKQIITRERLNLSKEYSQMRKKIKELKQEFKKFNDSRVKEMYRILTEIVKIKRALPENSGVGKNYTMRSLEWEEDLNLTSMEIRYISAYIFISDYGVEKVQQGFINDTTICHFLAISSLLREEKWQNKLIDLVIAKKIKVSQVSELTREELKLFLQGKLKIRQDDKYFLTATKTLRSMKKRILERKELLSNSMFKTNLINAINELRSIINEN